jgi:anti-sigma regulatory factor (Ser/Thr protein kinase)
MKIKFLYFILTALLFSYSLISFCQQQPELRFHKVSDELLQGAELKRFFVTKDGLLWFGTNKGLASFDGSEMIYYGNKGLDGPSNFGINDLAEDNAGNLWLLSSEYGLLFFNRKTGAFKKINVFVNEHIKASQITFVKVFLDQQEILWIGTVNSGLLEYNPATNIWQHYNIKPAKPENWPGAYENFVRDIIQDKNDSNILWLGCYGNGICSFNKKTKEVSRRFKSNNALDSIWESSTITNLRQINDSIIWYSTWGYGMNEYNLKTGLFRSYQRNIGFHVDVYPNGHVLEYIDQRSDSEFYVAPRDTIPAIFNIHTKKFSFVNDDELDKEYQRTQNVKTAGNNIVYYEKGGALFISSPRFSLFRAIKTGEKINGVYPEISCIVWDTIQQRYFAGILLGEGVNVYDKDFHLARKIPMPPYTGKGFVRTTVIWKLHRDKAQHLWALGDLTAVYDSVKLRFVPVANKWPRLKVLDSAMHGVAEDNNGLLYFSTFSNEFIIVNPFTLEVNKPVVPQNKKTPPLSFYNNEVLYDPIRQFIYFTNNNNLYQYNLYNKNFRKLFIDSSYYSNKAQEFLFSWTLDSEGFLWMTTPDYYLWKINPESLKIADTIKFINSRVDLNAAHLYGYSKELLFISTPKSQLLFNIKNYQCTYLNRNNGLFVNEGSKQMICNGNILFSYSGNGYTQFASIENLLKPEKKITPYITFILVNNKPLELDTLPQYLRNIQVDYTHNTISIGFSAIDHEFPDRLEYAYRLEKTETEWTYTNNLNRRINFANLSPGKYIFKLKAREWGSEWSPETNLIITITPPFWRTWWFISLSIIALSALLFWIAQWRINNIKKQERFRIYHEKELLELEAKALRAQMNPHFIFNCMNSIKSLIQQNEKDKAVIYLTTFSKLIRTIFQNSDKRDINLYDELETCRLYTQLESMRFGNKFTYAFNVDEKLDLKSIMVPALIIQPFIENAIRHGIMPKEEGGKVTVNVDEVNNNIRCVISDSGIGREMSKQNKFKGETSTHQSKGVHLTQARLNLDNLLNERNANVEIIDEKNENGKAEGTTVIIIFKDY